MFAALRRWFGLEDRPNRIDWASIAASVDVAESAPIAPPADEKVTVHFPPGIITTSGLSSALRKMKRQIDRAERKAGSKRKARRPRTGTKAVKRVSRKTSTRRKSRNRK